MSGIYTNEDAVRAVESANWDEHNSALPGYEIWGSTGRFAVQHAASHFTYAQAMNRAHDYKFD